MKKLLKKFRKLLPGCFVGIAFAAGIFVLFNIADTRTGSSEYCGTACHEMSGAYKTWQSSEHGLGRIGVRVECVDCHLPPKEDFTAYLFRKIRLGAKDIYKHNFGPPYDPNDFSRKLFAEMPDSACTACHNNLLANPSTKAVYIAHFASLCGPEKPENRCLYCHEHTGHDRPGVVFVEVKPVIPKKLPYPPQADKPCPRRDLPPIG